MARSLLLVGGGHAHVRVLAELGRAPLAGVNVVLVSREPLSVYSGMVPGVVAGQYRPLQARIDVARLAMRCGARFVRGRARSVDARARRVELEDGGSLGYDVLSLDVGSRPRDPDRLDPDASVIRVKPIECALSGLHALGSAPELRRIAVVGAGAGGAELALSLAARLGSAAEISVCDAASMPVAERGQRVAHLVLAAFAEHGVRFLGGHRVLRATRRALVFDDGGELPADLSVWATGAAAPELVARSGLPVDERGFLLVEDSLRSVGDGHVFAAGDCAALRSRPGLPKAGVFAVRQGPVLAANLRRALRGEPLLAYNPQSRFLSLLNTADGRAILAYGPIALRSRWAWRLKDAIDRRFVARFA